MIGVPFCLSLAVLATWGLLHLPDGWFVDDQPDDRPYWANRTTLYLRSSRRNVLSVPWLLAGVVALMLLVGGIGLIQHPA